MEAGGRKHARRWPFSPPPSSDWASSKASKRHGESGLPAKHLMHHKKAYAAEALFAGVLVSGRDRAPPRPSLRPSVRPSARPSARPGPSPRPSPDSPKQRVDGDPPRDMVYEIMPIVWMLRLMLMLPVTVLSNGNFRFRWLSVPVALSFATWLVLVVISYYTVRFRLDPVSVDGKHFHVWDLVPKYASSFTLIYLVFMPYSNWALTGSTIDMIERWKRVQAMIAALRGAPNLPRVRPYAWGVCVMSVGIAVVMQSTATFLLPDHTLWMLPALTHCVCFVVLGTSFWNVACLVLAIVARNLAASMIDDFQRLGVAGLRQHRRIWVALVKVVYKLSEAWGRTQAVLLGIFFVTAVSICFVLTHMVLSKSLDKSALWIGPALLLVILAFVSICHSAQFMIDAIRVPAKMQLLLLSFLVKDEETTTEIVQFLEEMYLERPRVSVCGLGDLSKASIVYAFGLANTYIVVLSQFSISAEALRANFIAD